MNHTAAQSLLYAVRPAVIAKRTGQFALLIAGVVAVTLIAALAAGATVVALRYGIVLAVLGIVGAGLARSSAPASIQANEALVICVFAFTLAPLAMTYPVMSYGIGFTDALFECVSGFTTTGLSTLGSVAGRPPSFLFDRAWMQWIGGLGILVLSVALLAGDDMAARTLVDSPVTQETLDTSTRLYARRCVVSYALLTAAAVLLLWLSGWRGVDAVLLAMAALSTGGFAPHDASLAATPLWPARMAVLGVALLGAVSLPLYHAAWRRRWATLVQDPELRLLLATCVLTSLALMLLMSRAPHDGSGEFAAHAVAMAVSAQTTSGFATLSAARLDTAAQLVLMVAMTVGGSVGSTAGGIKLLRLLLLLRMAQLILQRTAMPGRAVSVLRVRGHSVSGEELSGALFLALLFVTTVLLSWLPFLVLGHPPMAALFEVVSAVGTVGLSAGVAGPELHPLLKVVLCIDMLMGRVEFVAVLVMFYPHTWLGRRRST